MGIVVAVIGALELPTFPETEKVTPETVVPVSSISEVSSASDVEMFQLVGAEPSCEKSTPIRVAEPGTIPKWYS